MGPISPQIPQAPPLLLHAPKNRGFCAVPLPPLCRHEGRGDAAGCGTGPAEPGARRGAVQGTTNLVVRMNPSCFTSLKVRVRFSQARRWGHTLGFYRAGQRGKHRRRRTKGFCGDRGDVCSRGGFWGETLSPSRPLISVPPPELGDAPGRGTGARDYRASDVAFPLAGRCRIQAIPPQKRFPLANALC